MAKLTARQVDAIRRTYGQVSLAHWAKRYRCSKATISLYARGLIDVPGTKMPPAPAVGASPGRRAWITRDLLEAVLEAREKHGLSWEEAAGLIGASPTGIRLARKRLLGR